MSKKFTSFLLAAFILLGVITTSAVPAAAADGAQNYPLNSVVIKIEDAVTHSMLAGARFEIYYNNQAVSGGYGTLAATVDSDASGVIVISGLPSGYYIVRQTVPPNNYHLSIKNEQHCYIKPDGTSIEELVFSDYRYGGLAVILNDKDTGKPIGGATFSVTDVNNRAVGNSADGVYMTDSKGEFYLENLPAGDYKITQLTAAQGYAMDASPNMRTVRLQHTNADQSVFRAAFENSPLGSLLVRLKDSVSKEPLAGAKFVVKISGGADLGEFTTSAEGTFLLPKTERGSYIITQIAAPAGYIMASAKTQYVGYVDTFAADFENAPKSGLFIVKLDADTKEPLKDAKFRIYRGNTLLGTYTTGVDGSITIANLEPGWYTVSEFAPPQGYILDDAPQSVQVISEKLHKLTFEDNKLASLQIIKTDEYNGEPLSGAMFRVTKQSGEFVADVTTDANGKASVPGVTPGWYVVSETKAPVGYTVSEAARTVEVKAAVPTVVTITNKELPTSGLLIVKTDDATGRPLAGVIFDVRRADGQLVTGLISDGNQPNTEANSPNKTTVPNPGGSGDISGSYTTDAQGRIQINTLPAGEYHVIERKALDGYVLDENVHAVTVTPGRTAVLRLTNKAKAGFRLLKIDSVTKRGIYNVEFMVFDVNNKQVGTYITDNNGVIDFDGILKEGRYTLRETRPADGYYRDDMPRTVEFVSGKVTEVVWENTPQMGQIQITKRSGDDNELNGLEKGSTLAGAVFEIYEYKSGNLLDRFVSGTDGRAVSKPLPIGRYTVKEAQAPQYYRISDEVVDIEIEFATQIIKREFLNYSVNTGVKIRKTGAYEAMPGDTIRYDIKEMSNTSSIPLTDFFWRDVIPTDAVRLNKIVTGTYNQSLKYKVMVTTNKGDTRVIADNLSTTQNHTIDCRNAALGLANDEYATSFTLIFGTVKAGFTLVSQPQIYVTVNKNLPNGYEFGNKADAGGKYNGEFVVGGSIWVIKIYAQPQKLPRTGY